MSAWSGTRPGTRAGCRKKRALSSTCCELPFHPEAPRAGEIQPRFETGAENTPPPRPNKTKNLWKLCAVASNRNIPGRADHKRPSQGRLLRSFSVRGHRPKIMFGVLVVVLCPHRVAALGFSAGKC